LSAISPALEREKPSPQQASNKGEKICGVFAE
jgi:hypothetical protein